MLHARLRAQAKVHFFRQGNFDGVPLGAGSIFALLGGRSHQLHAAPPWATGACARERHGALCGLTGAVLGKAAVTREAPGAVDEHSDADAFCLSVGNGLDFPVLRRDVLYAPGDRARIGVTGARAERNVDCLSAQLSQGRA